MLHCIKCQIDSDLVKISLSIIMDHKLAHVRERFNVSLCLETLSIIILN